jgi:GAF domain-containing protein
MLARQRVEPFTERQIELVSTFADQAVIAIENTRLISEQLEALEQQTATAEVLQVINASPGNLAPVFDTILEKALRLCGAAFGSLVTFDGECFQFGVTRGISSGLVEALRERGPVRPSTSVAYDQIVRGADIVHIPDITDPRIPPPPSSPNIHQDGARTTLFVALRGDDALLGAFIIYRKEVRLFSDKEITLLQNFAAQAVIAMENARLLDELHQRTRDLQESLEYQTATSDVLKAISRAAHDLDTVLNMLIVTAVRLCNASHGQIWRRDAGIFRYATSHMNVPAYREKEKHTEIRAGRGTLIGRVALEHKPVLITDAWNDSEYEDDARLAQARSMLGVPLLRDGELIGAFALARSDPVPFTERQVEVVRVFADQTVIAMENARLLTEQREALEQQTATAEVLQVINASPGNLEPVFDAMLERALRLCDAAFGNLWTYDGEVGRLAAICGASPEYRAELMRMGPQKPEPGTSLLRLVEGEPLIHIADITAEGAHHSSHALRRMLADRAGARTVLWVPLRKDGALLGFFAIYRTEVRPFTDKQIALLQNFAAQAVIAIENTRLITEQREALEQLQVINASPGDLAPVFDAMLEKATRLCEADAGVFCRYDGEYFLPAAFRGFDEFPKNPIRPHPETGIGRLAWGEDIVHILDSTSGTAYQSGDQGRLAIVQLGGARTQLAAALRKEDKLLGSFTLWRRKVRGFTDKQIALLQSFAAQAVIAMENARLITEQREALEQQTATAEVLQVINSSPGDLAPVFNAMLEKAMRLCGASFGILRLRDGGQFHGAASRGVPAAYAEFLAHHPQQPGPGSIGARILDGEPLVHVLDVADDQVYRSGDPHRRALVELGGARTSLVVSLEGDQTVLGAIQLYRQHVQAFTDKQIALLQNFAAQAVVAMENARLINETREALEQQTATADVLQVINASPGDLAPVFDALLEKALRLCEAAFGSLATYDGVHFHAVAMRGVAPGYAASLNRPLPPFPAGTGRLVAGESVVHVVDITATDDYRHGVEHVRASADQGGMRTALFVALRKDDTLLGRITICRQEVRPFSDKQIALLRNFAAQAVIAMDNARLLTEQREALERQTATAEVLEVINTSPGNLAPVFNAVLERALRLCGAAFGTLLLYDGEHIKRGALLGLPPAFAEASRKYPLTKNSVLVARGLETRQPVQAEDILIDMATSPGIRDALVELGGVRALLQVPLLKEGNVIGFIAIFRRDPGVFPEKQVALLEGFAAQAVIAMENARLIDEQREALEQQTAVAEVLQVINASPGNLAPVFDTMLDKAMVLCGAAFGLLYTNDGSDLRLVAQRGVPEAFAKYRAEHPLQPHSYRGIKRLYATRARVHMLDLAAEYSDGPPIPIVELGLARTLLMVPLLKDAAAIGHIALYRQEVRAFSDKQISLLESFADQAVIAMENARLLTEQREALEQQTATAEVLQVINASPGDLPRVFDAMLDKALRLCDANFGQLVTFDGVGFRAAAWQGLPPEPDRPIGTSPPTPGMALYRLVHGDEVVHIPDITADEVYRSGNRTRRRLADEFGGRTAIWVALKKDAALVGAFVIYRTEVRPFSHKQIALLQNFAAQAVTAMENARLLDELRHRTNDLQESLEYQTETSDVMKVISRSAFDLDPVFEAVVATAVRLCNADQATIYRYQDGEYRWAAGYGLPPDYERIERECRICPGTGTLVGRVALERHTVQIIDAWTDPLYEVKEDARVGGVRTMLGVPLLRDGQPIGVIGLARRRVEPYTERHIALVSTFAEQGVIAIGSVETFKALQERTAELTRSVSELEALEEVLRAVNSSLDLDTVLDTIVSRAVRLSQADEGTLYEYDIEDQVFVPKSAFGMSADRVAALRERRIKLGETHLGRSAMLRAPVYVEDVQQDPSVPNASNVLPGIHAVLAVPLLRNDTVIGGLVIRRRTDEGFPKTIVTLMQTFSGQAVLAIENARLFQEAERARAAAEAALADLHRAQDRLVQSEKMASLGQLTAGIAHEIKNPLNFVNNFATLSVDLLDELKETAAPGFATLDADSRAEIDDLTRTLSGNLEKINEHGRRADGIVRSMLEHSRSSSGERRSVDLNVLVDEALNLAYHGARAQDQTFNITLQRDFGEGIPPITLAPQDVTRVLLNLFSNGFYAACRRQSVEATPGFEPTLRVTTRELGDAVEIRVCDNGIGIPEEVRDKLFQPFFTTKPTGEGTGLGLSISYDIVTQQHGGSITVDSKVSEYSEFTIRLPCNP